MQLMLPMKACVFRFISIISTVLYALYTVYIIIMKTYSIIITACISPFIYICVINNDQSVGCPIFARISIKNNKSLIIFEKWRQFYNKYFIITTTHMTNFGEHIIYLILKY